MTQIQSKLFLWCMKHCGKIKREVHNLIHKVLFWNMKNAWRLQDILVKVGRCLMSLVSIDSKKGAIQLPSGVSWILSCVFCQLISYSVCTSISNKSCLFKILPKIIQPGELMVVTKMILESKQLLLKICHFKFHIFAV